jgi:zinc finger protein
LTTVEGIVRDTIRDLDLEQPVRRHIDPETAAKIDTMLNNLRDLLGIDSNDDEIDKDDPNQKPFKPTSVSIDDPSGNSFFQFHGTTSDPQWNMRAYNRTFDQNVKLGLVARPDDMPEQSPSGQPLVDEDHKLNKPEDFEKRRNIGNTVTRADGTVVPDEIFSFPSTCSSCGHELETLMQQVNIPYFQVCHLVFRFVYCADSQNIIIMATNCYACGYRDNEIKSGGAVSEKGRKITLKVEDEEDMSRDMLKSDTAGLEIPEIDLVLQAGTLGGRFTTLEGLLNEIYNELSTKVFQTGDSATSGIGQVGIDNNSDERTFGSFLQGLKKCMAAEMKFTLILDDPVSNSYIQNLYAPDADPNMEIEEYERTFEQNDDLGLNDIVLDGYEEQHAEEQAKDAEEKAKAKAEGAKEQET